MKIYISILVTLIAIFHSDDQIYFPGTEWFRYNWTISFQIGALYLACVYAGQKIIKQKLDCRNTIKYWNFFLAIFSMFGTYRVGKEHLEIILEEGVVSSFCNNKYFHQRKVFFWYFLFVTSKIIEMGDTMFLIANKKPVRFIHWFHHLVTMIYSFYISMHLPAIGRWMSSMNFLVHSIMYSYYFLMTIGIKLPRFLSLTITTIQVLQMLIGFSIIATAYARKQLGYYCTNDGYTAEIGLLMYLAYVYLFVNLLYKSIQVK